MRRRRLRGLRTPQLDARRRRDRVCAQDAHHQGKEIGGGRCFKEGICLTSTSTLSLTHHHLFHHLPPPPPTKQTGQARRPERHLPGRPPLGRLRGHAAAHGRRPQGHWRHRHRLSARRLVAARHPVPHRRPALRDPGYGADPHRQQAVQLGPAGNRVRGRGDQVGLLLGGAGRRRRVDVNQPDGLGGRDQPAHLRERERAELPAADGCVW